MLKPVSDPARAQIIRTMIELTRPSSLHRIAVAGSETAEIDLELRRRGYFRVATTLTCVPRAQYSIGLVVGQHSLHALETALTQISHFLSVNATIAVVIDSCEKGLGLKVRDRLEQLGFRIQAGVKCHRQFVLAAHRHGFSHMAKAA